MKRVLVVGASSMIGCNLAMALRRSHRVFGTYHRHRPEIDGVSLHPLALQAADPIREIVRVLKPNTAIYCASETDEHRCTENPGTAVVVNAEAAGLFAHEMAAAGGSLIYLSSSKVFSGDRGNYRESDAPDGNSIYGQTKVKAESLLEPHSGTLILRLGTVFGLGQVPSRSFLNRFLWDLLRGRAIPLIADEYRSFYSVEEVCRLIRQVIEADSPLTGVYHVGQEEKNSYFSLGSALAKTFGVPGDTLQPVKGSELFASYGEARPRDLSLCGDELTRQTGFQARSLAESLERLRFALQNGKQ